MTTEWSFDYLGVAVRTTAARAENLLKGILEKLSHQQIAGLSAYSGRPLTVYPWIDRLRVWLRMPKGHTVKNNK